MIFKSEGLSRRLPSSTQLCHGLRTMGGDRDWIFIVRSTPARRESRKRSPLPHRLVRRCPKRHLTPVSSIIIATGDDVTSSVRWMSSPIAQRGLPRRPRSYMAIGAIERRQGKWAHRPNTWKSRRARSQERVGDAESSPSYYQPQEIEMAGQRLIAGWPPRRIIQHCGLKASRA